LTYIHPLLRPYSNIFPILNPVIFPTPTSNTNNKLVSSYNCIFLKKDLMIVG